MTAKWQYKQAYEAALEHNHELKAEADRLRERITTQKQTIQSYRDESREWREVADRAQAENAKLRELVRDMMQFFEDGDYCTVCEKSAE